MRDTLEMIVETSKAQNAQVLPLKTQHYHFCINLDDSVVSLHEKHSLLEWQKRFNQQQPIQLNLFYDNEFAQNFEMYADLKTKIENLLDNWFRQAFNISTQQLPLMMVTLQVKAQISGQNFQWTLKTHCQRFSQALETANSFDKYDFYSLIAQLINQLPPYQFSNKVECQLVKAPSNDDHQLAQYFLSLSKNCWQTMAAKYQQHFNKTLNQIAQKIKAHMATWQTLMQTQKQITFQIALLKQMWDESYMTYQHYCNNLDLQKSAQQILNQPATSLVKTNHWLLKQAEKRANHIIQLVKIINQEVKQCYQKINLSYTNKVALLTPQACDPWQEANLRKDNGKYFVVNSHPLKQCNNFVNMFDEYCRNSNQCFNHHPVFENYAERFAQTWFIPFINLIKNSNINVS